jgi:hypothetical protein
METTSKITQLTVGNISYCLQPIPKGALSARQAIQFDAIKENFVPVTAINWARNSFGGEDLKSVSKIFLGNDDVWCPGFLSGVSCQSPMPSNSEVLITQDGSHTAVATMCREMQGCGRRQPSCSP